MDFASRQSSNVPEQVMEFPSFGERPRTGLGKRNAVHSKSWERITYTFHYSLI
jgi:hypothetical protein